MADVNGGSLLFTASLSNEQLNAAVEETLRRVQGLSDGFVGAGTVMDSTTQKMVNCVQMQQSTIQSLQSNVSELDAKIASMQPGDAQMQLINQAKQTKAELDAEKQSLTELLNTLNAWKSSNSASAQSLSQLRTALGQIGEASETQVQAINRLKSEYTSLQSKIGVEFANGRDEEYRAIQSRMQALQGELAVRKSLLRELQNQSNVLEENASKIEAEKKKLEENANTQVRFRTELMNARNEMRQLVAAGQQGTEAYEQVRQKVIELTQAQNTANKQTKALASPTKQFQGMISSLNGIAGGFTAAQGAISLFGTKNEELQQIMLKVQSLMSITMGLQQVEQTLSKNSAAQLVTLTSLKNWWNNLLEVGRGEQMMANATLAAATTEEKANAAATAANTTAQATNTAAKRAGATATATNTAAQGANTTATGAQAAAATAGTAANIGLAGAFRMVGTAIKSIPMFGWILTAIAGLIALYQHFSSEAKKTKEAQEEFAKSLSEGCYESIGTVEQLSVKWTELGDSMEAKQQFIVDNQKDFESLGVAVNGVTDAENLLVANKQAFIDAQIEKAKAVIYMQQAQEKVKTMLENEQKINNMSDTVSQWVQTSSFGTGYYIEVRNRAKDELIKTNEELRKEITQGYTLAANAEANGLQTLQNASIQGTQTYTQGSLGAIEQAISLKQKALKNLTNNDDYKKAMKEIETLQKQADAITGKTATKVTTPKSSGGNNKDAFLEKLSKYKSEYQRFMKWINSGDSILVQSANKEFSGLLKEGATYIDWLKKQRDTILEVDVANRTATQNKQLRQLNDAIAEETKKTVLESFNQELSEQLTNAQTVMEMLNIIEKKRKELSNDGTELDNGKKEALDEAEKQAQEKAKSQIQSLLEEYSSYVEKKRQLEEDFNNDMILLAKARAEATTDDERANIDAAISNRKAKFDKDNQSSGDSDYDELKKQYKTYQSEITAIQNEYTEKRRVATLHNDQLLLAQLAQEEADKISEVQKNMLTSSVDWQQLFDNLDGLSTDTIKKLIASIEAQKINLSAQFNPQDLQAINEQLEKARDEIESRNPFKALGNAYEALRQSIKENKLLDSNNSFVQELNGIEEQYNQYKKWITSGDEALVKGANQNFAELLKNGGTYLDYLKNKKNELQGKIDMGIDVGDSMEVLDAMIHKVESGKSSSDLLRDALKDTFSSVSSSLEFVKGAFDSVTSGMEKMGIQMDDETQAIMTDIGGILEGSTQLSEGIASGNPLSIVQGSISLLSNTFDLFNSRDRKAEKSIKKHKEQIEKLQNAYKQLEWQIDKALGSEVYTNQKAAIENMQAQQEHLRGMISDERSKKKTDKSKIQEYQEQIEELDRQIEDMYDEISQDILQTDAKTFADTLGDALTEAFQQGEDAAESFESTVNEVLQNAIVNQLKKKFLEKQLQSALDGLEEDMGYWNGDDFVFDGLTDAEIEAFKAKVQAAANNYNEALKIYSDLFKDVMGDDDSDTSLSGAVKGVTEETANIVAGQINAVRINQIEATAVLRQCLQTLNTIATNTAFNHHLAKIDRIITLLEKDSSDSLRSQGLS